MLDRFAIYCVPVLAGLLVAAVLLGPGRERPVEGARVRGVLVESAREFAFRVETLRHHRRRYQAVGHDSLRLELRRAGRTVGRWDGPSTERGLAEARGSIDGSLGDTAEIVLWAGAKQLCRGSSQARPTLERLGWPTAPLRTGNEPVGIAVVLPRAVAVPSFPEPLRIDVTTEADDVDGDRSNLSAPTLTTEAQGATLGPVGVAERRSLPDGRWLHRWSLTIEVKALTAELTVTAETHDHQRGRWEGRLPVAAGGLWLAPTSFAAGQLEVRSATPRRVAYVSLLGTTGRLWGTTVTLHTDGAGHARGSVPLPSTVDQPLAAVLSTDPAEPEGATVAWPLTPDADTLPPIQLDVLVDGMPAAIASERARARGVRRPAYGLILAAGFFELLFLLRRNRLSHDALRQQMRQVAAATAERAQGLEDTAARLTGSLGLLWLTVLAAGVVLAFVVLAAVAAVGGGG